MLVSDPRATAAFRLLADLASVAEVAHTEATLGQRVADVVAAHLPLRRVEVARDGDPRAFRPAAPPTSEGATSLVVPLAGDGASVTLVFAADARGLDAAVPWGDAFTDALSRSLRSAFAQAAALSRVAALSRKALGERERLREELDRAVLPDDVVAVSGAMRRLFFETIPLVARQDVTLLVRGETGTGKEVVARRIHALSPRARRPFVKVNCGALPETLAESALFGHERGAFTGALQRHAGVFERAHGGTLLLDEVAELTAPMQARLLRVLQEGEFERLGGASTVRVDVRVIAATHRPLEAMVADGRFREDLFYRLQVVPLEVPPLRHRADDVDALARAALRRFAARMGREAPALTSHALDRLRAWPWPGNVRELENLLERALVLSPHDALVLPASFGAAPPSAPAEAPRSERFDDAQRRAITGALDACGGRIYGADGAAARLGLRPTTLQSKMQRLGLRAPASPPARSGR